MRKFLLAGIFALLSVSGRSSEIDISGYAGGNIGMPVTLYRYSDPVSMQKLRIGSTIPGSDGRFHFSIENSDVNEYFILNGMHENHFFVDGSEDIDLVLHPYAAIPPGEKQNPFFEPVFVYAGSTRQVDMNNLIIEIENLYMDAVERIIAGSEAEQISVARSVTAPSAAADEENGFVENWIRFRNASLFISGSRDKAKRGEIMMSVEKWFDQSNRASTEMVNEALGNLTREMSVAPGGEIVRRTIELGHSVIPIRDFATRFTGYTNQRMIEYVLVMNLYREYYGNYFDRDGILSLLGWMKNESIFEFTRNLSGLLQERITRFAPGSPLPGFSLKGSDGAVYTESSWKGKFILLSFARSDSWMTMSEFNILSEWNKRYSDYLVMVTILCDEDFPAGSEQLKSSGYDWLMLDGSGNYDITHLYDVRFYPSFCLADPEGKIVSSPAPFPSENLLQVLLEKLQPYLMDHGPE